MTRANHCPRCGARLPADAPEESLCPQCLLKLGLDIPSGGDDDVQLPTTEATAESTEGRPDEIGHYKILDTLGEGGMGIVYLAEQTEPVRRRVALKLIKLGMDTKQVIARFEAERQALALMNHANVAKVFDAGATEQGRPYFVMEYVPGIPLTEYCDMKCLSVPERLRLFALACEAIQHAHQKGIIHRDIKPSNVLVASEDGKPQLKVIDFGVAKATSQRLTEHTLFTEQGILIGTPEYMSPEQAGTTALDVDTRTDIYSLGVLLYELLVGALPFDPQMLRKAAAVEMQRIIREEDPPKPTTKFSSLGDSAPEVARCRHTDVRSLARQLRGEVDWITMRALEKEPSRRYGTASELALDVERHLRGEPVMAGPPGLGYRMRKLARKHRAAVIATTVVFAMLIVGLVTTTLLYTKAESARVRALAEAERNRLEAAALQAVLSGELPAYLENARSALAMHRSALGDGNPSLATHLLNHAGLLVTFGFDMDIPPAVLEEIEETADEAYALVRQGLREGRFDLLDTAELLAEYFADPWDSPAFNERAEELYRLTLEFRLRVSDPLDAGIASNRANLARLLTERARPLLAQGALTEAEPLYREAVALLRVTQKGQDRWLRVTESHLGECLSGLGRFEEAEPLLLGAHRSLEQQLVPASATRQMLLNRIVDLYERWGKREQAETYRRLLAVPSVAWFREMGPLPVGGHVGGASSVAIGEQSLWVFRGNTPTHDKHSATVDAVRVEVPDPLNMEPRETEEGFLPFTPEELEHNRAHTAENCVEDCGTHWDLNPGAVVADAKNGTVLLFYTKHLCPSAGFCHAEDRVGTSIASLAGLDAIPSRPVVDPGGRYPTMLFGADEPDWSAGALIDGGYLYAYAWKSDTMKCLVARVETSKILDRAAWRFYAGLRGWSDDWHDAQDDMPGASALTVHWNEYLRKYLAVYNKPFDSNLALRLADRPEGPWSDPVAIIEAEPHHHGGSIGYGLGHAHLAREGGRIEIVSYFRPGAFFNGQVHLIEVAFR